MVKVCVEIPDTLVEKIIIWGYDDLEEFLKDAVEDFIIYMKSLDH